MLLFHPVLNITEAKGLHALTGIIDCQDCPHRHPQKSPLAKTGGSLFDRGILAQRSTNLTSGGLPAVAIAKPLVAMMSRDTVSQKSGTGRTVDVPSSR
jgi:hypothetical protein